MSNPTDGPPMDGPGVDIATELEDDEKMPELTLEQKLGPQRSLTKQDKQQIWELLLYTVFISIFIVVTTYDRNMTDDNLTYRFVEQMRNLFVGAELNYDDSNFPKTFDMIVTNSDWWAWLLGPGVNNIFPEQWYNGEQIEEPLRNRIMHINQLVGKVRLRQVRSAPYNCSVPAKWKKTYTECYSEFTLGFDDTESYGPRDRDNNGKPLRWHRGTFKGKDVKFEFQSMWELNSIPTYGTRQFLGGGGFVFDLPNNKTEALREIHDLKSYGWIDRRTRAVFIDFAVYNPNLATYCVVSLLAEMLPSGGVIPQHQFRPVKTYWAVTTGEYFIAFFECFFVIMILYYIGAEIYRIFDQGISYFSNGWNILETVNLTFFLICYSLRVFIIVMTNRVPINPLEPMYINMQPLAYFTYLNRSITAVNGLLCWLKMFKFFLPLPHLYVMVVSLSNAARELTFFSVLFCIVMMGFAQGFYLGYSVDLPQYQSVKHSFFTLISGCFGAFDADSLFQQNMYLGILLYSSFILLMFFVMVNVFVAIICNSYDAMTEEWVEKGDKRNLAMVLQNMYMDKYGDQQARRRRERVAKAKERANSEVSKFDKDGDGKLSGAEIEKFITDLGSDALDLATVLKQFDKNGDGQIDQDEFADLIGFLADQPASLLPDSVKKGNVDRKTGNVQKSALTAMAQTLQDMYDAGELPEIEVDAGGDIIERLDESQERLSNIYTLVKRGAGDIGGISRDIQNALKFQQKLHKSITS